MKYAASLLVCFFTTSLFCGCGEQSTTTDRNDQERRHEQLAGQLLDGFERTEEQIGNLMLRVGQLQNVTERQARELTKLNELLSGDKPTSAVLGLDASAAKVNESDAPDALEEIREAKGKPFYHELYYDEELSYIVGSIGAMSYIVDRAGSPITRGYHEFFLQKGMVWGKLGSREEVVIDRQEKIVGVSGRLYSEEDFDEDLQNWD